jgi:hypothetical protein
MQQVDHRFAVALGVTIAESHAPRVTAHVRVVVGNRDGFAVIEFEMHTLGNTVVGVDFRTGLQPLDTHEHVCCLAEGKSFCERRNLQF